MARTSLRTVGIVSSALLLGAIVVTVMPKRKREGATAGAGAPLVVTNPYGADAPADDPVAVLRGRLASAGGTPEQIDNIVCVDNLKQVGAAMVKTGTALGDPSSLKNLLDTPLRLHCPQDTTRKPAKRWSEVGSSDISYVLGAGAASPGTAAIARCPIHGHIVLTDGRVIQGERTTK